jgi:hypothetical protein
VYGEILIGKEYMYMQNTDTAETDDGDVDHVFKEQEKIVEDSYESAITFNPDVDAVENNED